MKKKAAHKLKLHRETLNQLDGEGLRDAQGGFPISFTCSGQQPCQSISYCYVCRSRDTCDSDCSC
jgi:hypothetical protein